MDGQREHTMLVSGAGVAEVTPDMAQIDVSLEVTDADPAQAYGEVDAVARRVMAALDAHGIGEADRQTRAVGLQPQYVHDGTTATLTGYVATHTLRLRIVRLADVSELLAALVDAAGAALRLGGFTLGSRDTGEAVARAESAAVADARRRAVRLAEAAGVGLGAVLAVSDQTPQPQQHVVPLAWSADSAGSPVRAGVDTIQARVTLTFALHPTGNVAR